MFVPLGGRADSRANSALIVVRQSAKIGGQRSSTRAWRNSLSTLRVRKLCFRRDVVRPPITLADNGGQASAGPHERLGVFLEKEHGECDRLGKSLGKDARESSGARAKGPITHKSVTDARLRKLSRW